MSSVFQDVSRGGHDAAEVFFNLANENRVAYRTATGQLVTVRQDADIRNSTGGIVWETAYLLATFLEGRPETDLPAPGSAVLELGAGCGLLGLVLAHRGAHVVCSEAPETLPVLARNVKANQAAVAAAGGRVQAQQLRWEASEDCGALHGAPFDAVVGTDTVFSARLVAPMLATAASLSHARTKVWLCFQERCAAAHAELLRLAPHYFADVQDLSQEFRTAPGCGAARQLDCWLLCLSGARAGAPGAGSSGAAASETERPSATTAMDKASASSPTAASSSLSSLAPTRVPALVSAAPGAAAAWMSAAFAASSARAEPDADVPPTLQDDDDGFDGAAVAAAAARWAAAQREAPLQAQAKGGGRGGSSVCDGGGGRKRPAAEGTHSDQSDDAPCNEKKKKEKDKRKARLRS
jgi:predicted nicotinamide N-methyase